MTDAQNDALKRCGEILTEHFECGVLIVSCDGIETHDEIVAPYHGGFLKVLGLIEVGKRKIWHDAFAGNPPQSGKPE